MTTSNSFNPATVSITVAGMVTWTNNSGTDHNVTFAQAAGAPTNIPNFATGSASRSFASAGAFAYQCTIHPGMSGTVVVQ
jgi:plastocyanin